MTCICLGCALCWSIIIRDSKFEKGTTDTRGTFTRLCSQEIIDRLENRQQNAAERTFVSPHVESNLYRIRSSRFEVARKLQSAGVVLVSDCFIFRPPKPPIMIGIEARLQALSQSPDFAHLLTI